MDFRNDMPGVGRFRLSILLLLLPLPVLADRVLVLNTPQEFGQARLDMVNELKAGDEIWVSTYILANDAAGLQTLALLRRAAREGKIVHLLVDGLGWSVAPGALSALVRAGGKLPDGRPRVQLHQYHRLWDPRIWRLLQRFHGKLFITVAKQPNEKPRVRMVTGSANAMNISFGFPADFGVGRRRRHGALDQSFEVGVGTSKETEVYVEGRAAEDGLRYLKDLTASSHVSRISAGPGDYNDGSEEALDRAEKALRSNPLLDVDSAGAPVPGRRLHLENAREVGRVIFFHTGINSRRDEAQTMLNAIRAAKESILIANSYIVLPPAIEAELKAAIARGVKITLLTNSFESDENHMVAERFNSELPKLARMGIEVWQFDRQRLLHKKVMIIDGKTSLVSTFNLDPRSDHLQQEEGVMIPDDPQTARELAHRIAVEMKMSNLVASGGRLLQNPCVSSLMRLGTWFLRGQL